ncbi:MAG: RNA methyltransferase [bacterium]|nr:RNA methyltransferase [bacterium]
MKITTISSASNEKIKLLKKLQKKSVRDETGQFVVENLVIIHDAVTAGFKPTSLFVTQAMMNSTDKKLQLILKNCNDIFLINEKVNKSFSTLTTPAGLAAIFTKPTSEIIFDKHIVYCNAISDPGNLGAILRTAVAFAIKNIVVDENCADVYNPKTISAAKDAIFKVNIAHDTNLTIFKKIKNSLPIYATDTAGKTNFKTVITGKPFCLVLGNEANGVSKNILKQADALISINMSDNIESLNVAVSAGIIMQAIWERTA